MQLPRGKLAKFARELIDQCMVSRVDRANQNTMMTNYALCGGEDSIRTASFNKTYAYLDDLQSLLYSPVSLRFHIGDADNPNVLEEAKGRAASTKLRRAERRSETDTLISDAVWWSLVKGKTHIKSAYKRSMLHTALVQPDMFGVRHENHGKLDEDMEAFCQSIPLSFEQLTRMVWNRPDRKELLRKAEQFASPVNLGTQQAQRQIVTGGLYPLQPSGSGQPSQARGVVDWMSAPKPMIDPQVHARMVEMFELWVWDDAREDWTTLQLIGDNLLILGENQLINAFAWDTDAKETNPELKGHHPFNEFCVNPIDGYYWGRSEVLNVAMLQEMLSARIDGINRKIKKIEDPSYKASGVAGSNQNALVRFKKPGGYWADTNPNAKLELDAHELPEVLIGWVHEIERMFDEMGGLPPTARGHGDAGVRSHAHAETLVRMFSPRFKDRALLAERSVEGTGGLHLDMFKAHDSKKLIAWVPKDIAGPQGLPPNELIPPPAKNLVAVPFAWTDLDEDAALTVDSHSSSPAFSAEAKALTFDLLKVGAMSPEEVVERSDVSDPEELVAGIQRRSIARAEAAQQAEALKLATHGKK